MSRPISIPKLTLHRASGKAVVRLAGVDVYCGIFGTPEATAAYDRNPEGKPTSQLAEYRQTIRVVRDLYGLDPAGTFGPLALKPVRQKMVGDGLARSEVNRRVASPVGCSSGRPERNSFRSTCTTG